MAGSLTNSLAAVNDIRDIKPPVVIPNYWWMLWIAIGAIALVLLLVLFWKLWQKRRARISVVPLIPAHIRAKQKLQDALALIAKPKPFCILVSDTVRTYLEERFTFRAPERTTEEFLYELQETDLLAGEQKEKLGEFLECCDLVKFAKYEPGEEELKSLHNSALRLVEETVPNEQEVKQASEPIRRNTAQATLAKTNTKSSGQTLAVVGMILQLAPILWVVAYVLTIVRMLKLAGGSFPFESQQPKQIFESILHEMNSIMGNALVVMLIGVVLGTVGLILLIIALVSSRYRQEWFFWFLIVYGTLLLIGYPIIGTAVGIFFIVYCLTKRREFFHPS